LTVQVKFLGSEKLWRAEARQKHSFVDAPIFEEVTMPRVSMRSVIGSLTIAVLAATADVALAGPPLLCHPFDIGTAKSLTWDNSNGWQGRTAATNMKTLVADTEAILTPDTPVIVRMETLRRAALYASTDAQVATELFTRLQARASTAKKGGLETFDAGYLIETFREITRRGNDGWKREDGAQVQTAALQSLLGNADGEAMVQQSLAANAGNPSIEFAAALIAASYKGRNADYLKHAQKARAGAAQDALLTKNLNHISGT
jgi:hypothetical protein